METDQELQSIQSENVSQVKPGPLSTPPDFQKSTDAKHLPKEPPDASAAL